MGNARVPAAQQLEVLEVKRERGRNGQVMLGRAGSPPRGETQPLPSPAWVPAG